MGCEFFFSMLCNKAVGSLQRELGGVAICRTARMIALRASNLALFAVAGAVRVASNKPAAGDFRDNRAKPERPPTGEFQMSDLVAANDANFKQEVLDSGIPVIVDFWATWCGPCRMMAPIFEKVSEEFQGRVKFVKFNVEDSERVPAEYGIRNIPTMIAFKNGEPVRIQVGLVNESTMAQFARSLEQ